MVVLQNWSYSCKWGMPHTHNWVCFSVLQLLWQPLKLCCIIKFPYLQLFSCSEHPLFYIKRKELEKWSKCGWILLSIIRESCRIKLGFQVPKSYQSVLRTVSLTSSLQMSIQMLHPKWLLHADSILVSVEDSTAFPVSGPLYMLSSVPENFSVLFFHFS